MVGGWDGAGAGRAMTALTGVYYVIMDDCVEGFLENGCAVRYPAVRRNAADPQVFFSEPALREAVREGRYDFFFAINGDGLDDGGIMAADLMRLKKTIALWYVDDPFNSYAPWHADRRLGPAARDYERLFFFAVDETFVESLKARGYRNAVYLPHAVNPAWAEGAADVPNLPDAPVTFVGNLDLASLPIFDGMLSEFDAGAARLAREYAEARCERCCLAWEDFLREAGAEIADPDGRVRHAALRLATIRCKLHLVRALETVGVNVYGFEDWKEALDGTAHYKGPVPYYAGLSTVYRRSLITLNISHAQMSRGCNQRLLDVPACGGFLITDARPAIRDLLPGLRVPQYGTAQELVRRIHDAVRQPERRAEGIRGMQEMIRARHTYGRRMKTVLEEISRAV